MTTPKEIKKYFAKIGAKGGKVKSKKKTEAAKKNIMKRWAKESEKKK